MTSLPVRPSHVLHPQGHPLLGGAPGDLALVAGERTLTYAELADAVDERARLLGDVRRLVLLEAGNDLGTVVTYLAALAGGHPVILVPPSGEGESRHAQLVELYRPDVVAAGETLREQADGDREGHDGLHPDLAVLLSTSGSTGSPKLVRLSRDNLVANAAAIGAYLGIRPTDRAMTSLPLHYCYGLSVLNSHLLAGAAVVLTDLSVVDECFWELAGRVGATTFAGVPYTFDLLEASGFERRSLPSLRYLTQAGGRMAPDRVRRYARLGRERGFDLFVMYGQTEATARMAYLPPDLAADRPEAIGVPIPGGSFRLEPVEGAGPGVGELVYSGPNVMMGYAVSPVDLARGPELTELRTGDLARQADDGLWEVTGRLSRFGKIVGLRIDLDRVEQQLGEQRSARSPRAEVRAVAPTDALHVFVASARAARGLRDRARQAAAVPAAAVHVHVVDELPRTANGKTDYAALDELARAAEETAASPRQPPALTQATPEALRDLYAVVLGRPHATLEDSFVSLGGDSLSFVEVSTRLGAALGNLPAGWQHLSVTELAARARPARRRTSPVETTVVLRAIAILLIVTTHTDLSLIPGGAHLLLTLAGFNLARFVLPVPGRVTRVQRVLRAVAGVAVPSGLWIGLWSALGHYSPATAVFLNGALGSSRWDDDWRFWFIEAVVWGFAGAALLLAVPAIDRVQRNRPFASALALVGVTLAVRYAWVGVEARGTEEYAVGTVLWCLALGLLAHQARTRGQRLLTAALVVAGTLGFFGDLSRELVVIGGLLLAMTVPSLRLPRALVLPVSLVAGASMWIYLTHWQVYPQIEAAGHPFGALCASVVVGVAVATAHTGLTALLRRLVPARSMPRR